MRTGRRRRRSGGLAALALAGAWLAVWLAALAAGAPASKQAAREVVLLTRGAATAAGASAALPGFGARNALGAEAPSAGRVRAGADADADEDADAHEQSYAVWATPLFARMGAGDAGDKSVRVAWLNGTTAELPAVATAPASSVLASSAPASSGADIPFTVAAQPWSAQYLDVAPDRPSQLVFYSLAAVEQYLNYAPVSWYVLGSVDRVQWFVLDAQRNVSWRALRSQTFHVKLPTNASSTFSVYRILVTQVEGCECTDSWSAVVLDKLYLFGFLDEPGQGGSGTGLPSGGGGGGGGGHGANSTNNTNTTNDSSNNGNSDLITSSTARGTPFRLSMATQMGLGIVSFLGMFSFIILCYVGRQQAMKRRREREAIELEHVQARAAPPAPQSPGTIPRSPARSPARSPYTPVETPIPAEELAGERPSLSPSLRLKPRLHSDGSHASRSSMASTSSFAPRGSRTEDNGQARSSVASKVSTFLRGSRTEDTDPTFAVAPAQSAQSLGPVASELPKGRSARKSVSDVL
jgi:hypothetical protein